MIPARFEYYCSRTLQEVLPILSEYQDEAKLLAGGQSLISILKLRLASPKCLVDIGQIDGLRYIREQADGRIVLGAMTTYAEIRESKLLQSQCPLLPQTAAVVGDVQVRNRGTIGGSIAHADPAGDFPAAILALDAELTTTSAIAQRTISAQDFFVGILTSALYPNEILTSIRVPKLGPRTGSAYVKMSQQASGFAIVGVAAILTFDEKGKVTEARVGITGVASVPYRAKKVEAALRGTTASAKEIAAAAALAAKGVDALSDIHASAAYRRDLAAVFTRRSLEKAAERAGRK